MSLILEALKKLDREKQVPERGVVVLGATAWAARREGRGRVLVWLLVDLALVAVGAAVAVWWLAPGARPQPVAVSPMASAAPVASSATPAIPRASEPALLRAAANPPPARPSRPLPTPSPRTAPVAAPAFALQAITEQDGVPVALINERVLRVGEGFDGMRVLRISPTEVEIQIEASGAHQILSF